MSTGLRILIIIAVSATLLRCGTSDPTRTGSSGEAPNRSVRILNQIEQTPDSLATLPAPRFYESASFHQLPSDPWSLPEPFDEGATTSPQTQIKIVGGASNSRAQFGILTQSKTADASNLRSVPYVTLYGQRLAMRRGQAWRTIKSKNDSLVDQRFIPLLTSDIQRLMKADTARLVLNGHRFRLPNKLRSEYKSLLTSAPDTLLPDTSNTQNFFTLYHDPDTPAELEGSMAEILGETVRSVSYQLRNEYVLVQAVVGREGTVKRIDIKKSSDPRFSAAVADTYRHLTFKAGRHKGQSVPVLRTNSAFIRTSVESRP